jgi:glycosyltransferase 2 family protein
MYAVYSKIPLEDFKRELSKLSWISFTFGFILFTISMSFSTVRLSYFIKDLGLDLPFKTNSKLYILGMFYNLFIPGGVGGDAYKIYYLNRKYDIKTKESFWPFLLDRGSGFFALLVLILVSAYFLDVNLIKNQNYIITGLIILGFVCFFTIVWIIKKAYLKTVLKTLPLSFFVQICQAGMVYIFIHEIGVTHHSTEYFFLFFVSSIATIIPITPGGIGLRELTYQYGGEYLQINPSIGAFVATLFFAITLIFSFTGIFYHFKGVDKIKNPS